MLEGAQPTSADSVWTRASRAGQAVLNVLVCVSPRTIDSTLFTLKSPLLDSKSHGLKRRS